MDQTRYVKATRYDSPYYVAYVGQGDDVIQTLLTDLGCTDITFITEDVYNAAVATQGGNQ